MKSYKNIITQNEEILQEIQLEKNLANSTLNEYKSILNEYCIFHNKSMTELIDEADYEEEQNIRMKKRKIKQRILQYRKYLQDKQLKNSSINNKVGKIKTTYRFYDIEVPQIRGLLIESSERYEDIPTKENIRYAVINTSNLQTKTMILFLASSGCAVNEMYSITIKEFINATREYHTETKLENVLNELEHKTVIPTFQLIRQKTHYSYYCFCTPEAVNYIILMLKKRLKKEDIPLESHLFNITPHSVSQTFRRLNDRLMMGYVKDNRRFFHPHALRKFFATTLLKADLDPMTIDFLSGRHINKTHEAYFKADPNKLKMKYTHFVPDLTILENVKVNDITTAEKKELENLRENNNDMIDRINKMEKILNQLQNM